MFTLRQAATRAAAVARRTPVTSTTAITRRTFSVAAPRAFASTWTVRNQERPLEPLDETVKPGVESGVTLESEAKLAQAIENQALGKLAAAATQQKTHKHVPKESEETLRIRDERDRTLFVQNMSWEIKEADVREDFSAFGEIDSVYLPGQKKSWCLVTFVKEQDMRQASAQVNNTFWHGRRITAVPRKRDFQPGDGKRPPLSKPSLWVYVGNLPYDLSDSELTQLFDVEGAAGVRVGTNPSTGFSLGYAHVSFRSIDEASKAITEFNSTVLKERRLRADFAQPPLKKREPEGLSREADWSQHTHRSNRE